MKSHQMINRGAGKIFFAALLAATAITSLSGQTLSNGDFELVGNPGTVSPGNSFPQTNFDGWSQPNDPDQFGTLFGAEGYLPNATTGVTDGFFAVGIPFSPNGGIFAAAAGASGDLTFAGENLFQTISGFEEGKTYEVSFWQTNIGTVLTSNQKLGHWDVTLFGEVQSTEVLAYQGEGNQTWIRQTLTFLAIATSSVLDLRPITDEATGLTFIGIDGVTVTAVPEPSSTMLLGGAVMGLAFFRRRNS